MARPRSFDRDHVLHAAERQFRASGYNGTSVDDISAATGLGRGSLYAAFDGKHGVLLEAMAGYFGRLAQGPGKMLDGPDEGALERLHAYLLRAVHGVPLAADVPPAPDRAGAACFAAKMALEIGASDPEVKRLANDCFTVVATAVAECLRAAQRNGDIDPDADPDDLAYLLLTVIRGSDVVGAYGHSPARLTSIAESAFALLPRPRHRDLA
ncbi:TetR/AcrR family transcriptional regulator [Streptomyces acidiscabies]|uniref:TetR/AcrR family transcriptional regulator n=1 Tax=Streptomyces acidiscabies TaxID=42234 RepID=A0AAP6BF20_9ACTN|nr:TetR/AcrR family transcriptional regulator [Streptomyces acidiscabies]MBP5934854.1 TetR/AcrR family transcriptional regulator [Streptomyces sp. LBUM 1476]MBZ3917390.1 TetR/AcrR family transcriptional regulator [Streptomyces acidiscabies]MDX2963473.1 TetR/AcrR family transcriptional regulator [Streptomyces acidiscabies]MDX3018770.1 TetR/AcrR family transcriptional regulator [Streptomyces acidiscabies]MDX3790558.1 TetR/AcrR family transcriptional regulator [Streptomyces acidiscabies]